MNRVAPPTSLVAIGFAGRLGAAALAIAAATCQPLAHARPTKPTNTDRKISILVTALMDRRHLSGMRIDDEISRRAFELYFQTLDPLKLYLYQSDIDQFMNEKERLDDYLNDNGNAEFAKRVFDVFLQRVQERVAVAHKWVDAEHDFTLDETIVSDPKKLNWVASVPESDERWRKRVKYDLLLQLSEEASAEQAKERLHKRYRSIEKRWSQIDNDELMELFLSAVTTSFDPHSSYMSPESFQNFLIQMKLELDGIGASLESKYGETVVRHIVPGGAADKDGRLEVDDVILSVDEKNSGEMIDIVDMKLNDVVQMIRGKPNTVVRLEVKKAAGGIEVYDITRARIELKDSEARSALLFRGPHGQVGEEDALKKAADLQAAAEKALEANAETNQPVTGQVVQGQEPGGAAYKIGVIDLPSFYMDMDGRRDGTDDYKSTTRDVRRLLDAFNKQEVDLVIVDLRFNGGGSLPESVTTTGLFIDRGPVVQVKGPDGRTQALRDEESGAVWKGPLIVLINKFSASASEIFAGAIQDYGRGIIVGDHATHGKGTVQQLYPLGKSLAPLAEDPPNFGALKLTIQQFYRPGGDSTQNRGVVSDIELPSQTSHWEVGESDLEYALRFDRVAPMQHDNYPLAGAQVIHEVRRRSNERSSRSDHFALERKRIERYNERKIESIVTLNREKFLAEIKELNTEKEQEKMFDDLQANDRPIFPASPYKDPNSAYNDEVIAIALDYLELLGDSPFAAR